MSDTLSRTKGEWKETTITEIVTPIGGGTPKTSVSEYWDGQIPWLSVVDFNNGKKYVFVTEKKNTDEHRDSGDKLLERLTGFLKSTYLPYNKEFRRIN